MGILQKRCLACVSLILILLQSVTIAKMSAESVAGMNTAQAEEETGFSAYWKTWKDYHTEEQVELEAGQALESSEKTQTFRGRDKVLCLETEKSELSWRFTVNTAGYYVFSMFYTPLESKKSTINFAALWDNALPYEEMGKLTLPRPWLFLGGIAQDSRGNDIQPEQAMTEAWTEQPVRDEEHQIEEPLGVYLSPGEHTLHLVFENAQLALKKVVLKGLRKTDVLNYKEYQKQYTGDKTGVVHNVQKKQQAESAIAQKSDSTIQLQYDRSNPANEPSSPRVMKLNTVGGSTWKKNGQWIVWNFTVPEDGFYNVGMRVRQNVKYGMTAHRRITIDGKVPFQELQEQAFPYESDWYLKVLGGDETGTPYAVYLKAGEHQLGMEVVSGSYKDTAATLVGLVSELNALYRNVIMVTGSVPDPLRDYDLEASIPGITKRLASMNEALNRQREVMEANHIQTGSETAVLDSLLIQIDGFLRDLETMPFQLDSFKSNISALADWLATLQEQPLEIDYFVIQSLDQSFPKANRNFLQNLWYELQSIVYSFAKDYGTIGDYYEGADTLNVWTALGREQMGVLQTLAGSSFTPATGIRVNISLIRGGLVEAVLAGTGPDVAVFTSSGDPVNLAARGAVLRLDDFDGFSKVIERFYPQALVPYRYQSAFYGLPVTQEFPMLFYRKDILDEFGLKPPTTWDELLDIAPVLQRKNLEIGLPSAVTASSGIYPSFLIQQGTTYFSEDFSRVNLDTEAAVEAFGIWTDFYTKYGFPLQYDFFNRFRSGEMPLAIASYITYNQLDVAAPEIKGLWGMMPVPGTKQADGSINADCTSLGGTGAIILRDVKHPEDAWKFLDWVTSDAVQAKLGLGIEALLGPLGRYATANRQAFTELPWPEEQAEQIQQQWGRVKEVGVIPASYIVDRNVANAFKKVVYNNANPRETLMKYAFTINKEIARKNEDLCKRK